MVGLDESEGTDPKINCDRWAKISALCEPLKRAHYEERETGTGLKTCSLSPHSLRVVFAQKLDTIEDIIN